MRSETVSSSRIHPDTKTAFSAPPAETAPASSFSQQTSEATDDKRGRCSTAFELSISILRDSHCRSCSHCMINLNWYRMLHSIQIFFTDFTKTEDTFISTYNKISSLMFLHFPFPNSLNKSNLGNQSQ